MYKLFVFFICMLWTCTVFCTITAKDLHSYKPTRKLIQKRVNKEIQDGIRDHITQDIPYPGRTIVASSQDRMLEYFDSLIYKNNVEVMRGILADPVAFTASYELEPMTAEQLCNMKRKNTGNISLHIAAACAYEDLTMAELLSDGGADVRAVNS